MKLHLACHDQAFQSPDGNYWVWRSDRIAQVSLPDYYFVIAKKLPNATAVGSSAYEGIVAIDDRWFCFYRWYDGGRDLVGRPGRIVLLCGFVKRNGLDGLELSEVLRSEPFLSFGTHIQSGVSPPTEPSTLDVDIHPDKQIEGQGSRAKSSSNMKSLDSVPENDDVWFQLSCMKPEKAFHLVLSKTADQTHATIHSLEQTIPGNQISAVSFANNPIARQNRPTDPQEKASSIWIKRVTVFIGVVVSVMFGILVERYLLKPSMPEAKRSQSTNIEAWLESEPGERISKKSLLEFLKSPDNSVVRNHQTAKSQKDSEPLPKALQEGSQLPQQNVRDSGKSINEGVSERKNTSSAFDKASDAKHKTE